jgi:hypothetical protein
MPDCTVMPPVAQVATGADLLTAYTTELAPLVAGVAVEALPPPPPPQALNNKASKNAQPIKIFDLICFISLASLKVSNVYYLP